MLLRMLVLDPDTTIHQLWKRRLEARTQRPVLELPYVRLEVGIQLRTIFGPLKNSIIRARPIHTHVTSKRDEVVLERDLDTGDQALANERPVK